MQTQYNTFEILDTPRPFLCMTGSTGSTTPVAPWPRRLFCGPHAVAPQQRMAYASLYDRSQLMAPPQKEQMMRCCGATA